MLLPDFLAAFRESTHFQLWTYIVATPLGGLLLFVGYLLLSWAWQTDQGRSLWLMVAGLVGIIALRFWSGDFTYGFVGAVLMLFRVAPEVRHLDAGRWGRNFMVIGLVSYLVGLLNTPYRLPADLTETELYALQAVESMGKRARKEERRKRAREARDPALAQGRSETDADESDGDDEDQPRSTPAATPKPTVAVAAATPPPLALPAVARPSSPPLVLRNAADVQREGLALKARERKLVERKKALNLQDREAVQWLTEDIQRYNADQQQFHQQALKIDPNYAAKLTAVASATPSPARRK